MVEKTPWLDLLTYTLLILGIGIVGFPLFYTIVAATLPVEEVSRIPMPLIPGDQLLVNLKTAWIKGNLGIQMWNSFIMAAGITFGKISVSMLAAFAIVYFDFRFRKIAFVSVFCTLMLPVEVRILPTYEVTANVFGPIQRIMEVFLYGYAHRIFHWQPFSYLHRIQPAGQLCRSHSSPGRLCHRNISVSAIFPDYSGRTL